MLCMLLFKTFFRMKSKLNNMTYKIRCGLSSAYHSSFIHYHTLRTQYTPVYLLIHHLSYLEVFAHGVFLPRPLYLNVMFYLTNSTFFRCPYSYYFLCETFLDLPMLQQCYVLYLIWRVTTQYNNGLCLIWIVFQTIFKQGLVLSCSPLYF